MHYPFVLRTYMLEYDVVWYGKSTWPYEETRMKVARKKFIMLVLERRSMNVLSTARKHQVLIMWQKTVREKLRPDPILGFL